MVESEIRIPVNWNVRFKTCEFVSRGSVEEAQFSYSKLDFWVLKRNLKPCWIP